MRYYIFLTSLILVFFTGCKHKQKQINTALYDYILPQASYVIKVNKPKKIIATTPVIIDKYLTFPDKSFLSKVGFETPYLINILQNNSKIKGFVATGTIQKIDSSFNGDTSIYDQDTIYSASYKKTSYYATVLNGVSFVSNQKLFIETCIRDWNEFGNLSKNSAFKKGVSILDNNADFNIIVKNRTLKPDIFFNSSLKIKWKDIGDWQFFDMVEVGKNIASGISLSRDSTSAFAEIFKSIQPATLDFGNYIPFSVDEVVTLSVDDFEQFTDNLNNYKEYAPNKTVKDRKFLSGVKALSFFKENNNNAMLFKLSDFSDLTEDNIEKIKDFNNYEINKFPYNNLIKNYFSNILPNFSGQYFSIIDNVVLITTSQTYLEKILNDIQNHATLSKRKTYQDLTSELPNNYHIILLKNKLKINGEKFMKAQTFKIESETVFTNFVLKSFNKDQGQMIIEQALSYNLSELPKSTPQLVYNHSTRNYNIIFQDEKNRLNFVNLKGRILWQTEIKGEIIGKIHQVDLFRNHKIQYTFVTPHNWYVIDRLGRKVENFPKYFLEKNTQGISVFDYEHNRKYRFGITQSKKFKLFDNDAKKVKGFKFKAENDILFTPKHFRIGNKDFIQISDNNGKIYLLNRRGEMRIKLSEEFDITRNQWGSMNHKFVNIDDNNKLLSIDLNGKIKNDSINFPEQILSDIKYETLTAKAGNKLLINQKVLELDLGTYSRPQIYKSGKQVFVFIANSDNNKIYAFDKNGKAIANFPIIGQQVLDFKTTKQTHYLLVYDSSHNLIVYKF